MPCQKYSDIFSNLTPVKEAFIAYTHLIISVIKLRPSKTGSTASCHRIWGHIIILSQNLGPLLTILPSSHLALHNMICMAWVSKHLYIVANICFLAIVQKTRVLEILY